MSSYADIVKTEQVNTPVDVGDEFSTWPDVLPAVHKELFLRRMWSKQFDPMFAPKMEVIIEENGQMLCDVMNELKEYYDMQGFLDTCNVESFAKAIQRHVTLEEPESQEENDADNLSDLEEF